MRGWSGLAGGKTTQILQEVVQLVPSGSGVGPGSWQSLYDQPGLHTARSKSQHHHRSIHRQQEPLEVPRAPSSTPWKNGARRPRGWRLPRPPQGRPAAAHAAHMGGGPAPDLRGRHDAGSPGRGAAGPQALLAPRARPPPSGLLTARSPSLSLPARVRTKSDRFQRLARYR